MHPREAEFIHLKVVNQSGNEVNFRVRKTTKMKKLKEAFCDKIGTPTTEARFFFDGRRVEDEATPGGLDMESGDTIEVFGPQKGGAEAWTKTQRSENL